MQHRAKLFWIFPLHLYNRQVYSCCHNLMTLIQSYNSKNTPSGKMYAVKIAEAVLLYAFTMVFPTSPLPRSTETHKNVPPQIPHPPPAVLALCGHGHVPVVWASAPPLPARFSSHHWVSSWADGLPGDTWRKPGRSPAHLFHHVDHEEPTEDPDLGKGPALGWQYCVFTESALRG